jgi:uncharacterized protein YrrD
MRQVGTALASLQSKTGSKAEKPSNNHCAQEVVMLRSAKSIRGYSIRATDGDIGKAHDILFDDRQWRIRYLVVDTGTWLPGRKVLIFPIALAQPDWQRLAIPVGLSKERIHKSPTTEADKPVSKQHERELHTYFNWAPYWPEGAAAYGTAYPPIPQADQEQNAPGNDAGDPHLRSTREVTGYHIQALDGQIGHVEDFILDDEDWTIRYLIIDTRNWLPGRKVIVSPMWIDRVSWSEKKVFWNLSQKEIKKAPEYDPSAPINREYEARLYDYYGRPAYF